MTRMTNEEAAAMLESMKKYFIPTSPMLEDRREITALDLAISALSKQCSSSGQADQRGNNTEMVDQFRDDTKMTDDVPDTNVGKTDDDTISRQMAIDIVEFECGEWSGLAKTIVNGLKKLSTKQSEKIPYKKPEIIDIAKVTMAMAKGADMVPVTRCKDCKYSVDEYSEGDCYCRRPKKGIDYIGNWNFYCADAERRNDG